MGQHPALPRHQHAKPNKTDRKFVLEHKALLVLHKFMASRKRKKPVAKAAKPLKPKRRHVRSSKRTTRPVGRPPGRSKFTTLTFRADAATIEAVKILKKALVVSLGVGAMLHGGRSHCIRRAILEAAGRLPNEDSAVSLADTTSEDHEVTQ